METIGISSFEQSGIEEIQTPPSLKAIGDGAFSNCKQLKYAVLNEGLETLGNGREIGCFESSSIENVVLPSTLKRLEKRTFYNCKKLNSI